MKIIFFFPLLPIKKKIQGKGLGERIEKKMSCLWAKAKNNVKEGILWKRKFLEEPLQECD